MNTPINEIKQEFRVHPALIYSLILKQASGAPKALLELVMNCVDAGATRIDITLDADHYVIADNGCGFKDEETITAFFGTFGTPHAEGDAYYGRFRLGRAQSFGIARSKWYSKDFCMEVDLNVELNEDDKEVPLGYLVTKGHPYYQGCKIVGEFYHKQDVGSVEDFFHLPNHVRPENLPLIPALIKMIRYLPVDVFINEVQVNVNIENAPITETTLNANYILEENESLRTVGVINVYNLGVYAYPIPSDHYYGNVVTSVALDLNIARNEAKATCAINKEVRNKIKAMDRKFTQKPSLKKSERREKRITDSEQAYSDHLWSMLLGLKPFNEEFFKNDFSHRAFVLASDEKVSFRNVVERLIKCAGKMVSGDLPFYLYNDDDFVNTNANLDFITVENGFIPRSIFPSDEFLAKLTTGYAPTREITPQYQAQLTEDIDFTKLEENQRFSVLAYFLITAYSSTYENISLSTFDPSKGCYEALSFSYVLSLRFEKVKHTEAKVLNNRINSLDVSADLTPFEAMVKKALAKGYNVNSDFNRKFEVVEINNHSTIAYTDGANFVKFNYIYFKDYVQKGDFEKLISIYLHEMAHNSNSQGTHQHGAKFYDGFNYLFSNYFNLVSNNFYSMLALEIERFYSKTENYALSELGVNEVVMAKIAQARLNLISTEVS